MKTKLAILFAVGLTACSPQKTSDTPQAITPASLPKFTFREMSPETPFSKLKKETFKDCKTLPDTTRVCQLKDRLVAGGWASDASVVFYQKGLTSFSATYKPTDFEIVKQNLTSAYGPSCSAENTPVQNAFGTQYVNERVAWCFAEGWLILSKYNDKIDETLLIFGLRDVLGPTQPPEKVGPSNL